MNIWLSRRYEDHKVFRAAVICQNVIMMILVVGTFNGWYGLAGNVVLLLSICRSAASPIRMLQPSRWRRSARMSAALRRCSAFCKWASARSPPPVSAS